MRGDECLGLELDRVAWDDLQETVARFRTALRRGDRPAIETHVPADGPHRAAFLTELVHERSSTD